MNEQKNTTKTQIKQAAIRQIEKFGIDKTSMRSIAAEANMTTGAIYYYYKNKQDLFDEIVTDSIHFAHRIFHENENEKITVDSLFSDVEKEARIRFKRLQEEKLYLLLLSDAMKCDSEFSQKYTSGLKSILDQAATLFASAFALDDRKLAEQFASIFMATLDGFAIQQVLHAIPKDDTSYADTLLDFFTTCTTGDQNPVPSCRDDSRREVYHGDLFQCGDHPDAGGISEIYSEIRTFCKHGQSAAVFLFFWR